MVCLRPLPTDQGTPHNHRSIWMSETLLALYVFVLACFIGYYVIWGVTPSLHTPLVS